MKSYNALHLFFRKKKFVCPELGTKRSFIFPYFKGSQKFYSDQHVFLCYKRIVDATGTNKKYLQP